MVPYRGCEKVCDIQYNRLLILAQSPMPLPVGSKRRGVVPSICGVAAQATREFTVHTSQPLTDLRNARANLIDIGPSRGVSPQVLDEGYLSHAVTATHDRRAAIQRAAGTP